MKSIIISLTASFALFGCASGDYKLYAETQQEIARSKALAESARYQALAEIAKTGDSTTKVAATMAIAMGQGGADKKEQDIAAPKSPGDTALQWASILVPSATQLAGIASNAYVAVKQSNNQTSVALAQSNNSASVAKDTNDTMQGIANLITLPEPTVVTATNQEAVVVNPVVVDPTVVNPVVVNSNTGSIVQ